MKDFDHIINTCSLMDQEITPATLSEIRYAISRLKTNKAADYLYLTSKHLKYCGLCVITSAELGELHIRYKAGTSCT